ncbi:MAG TPA: hypothetical protein VGK35_14560, partial [Actinotalea sp.]
RNDVTVPDGPVEWWAELRHRLALRGFSWSDATTPRQAAEVVRDFYRAQVRERGHDAVPLESQHALDDLVGAVEGDLYAPAPQHQSTEQLRGWVDAIERPWAEAAEHAQLADAGRR